LGTSLPDTFASRIAARSDKTADNAIGKDLPNNLIAEEISCVNLNLKN
jgi:hypothetical protein